MRYKWDVKFVDKNGEASTYRYETNRSPRWECESLSKETEVMVEAEIELAWENKLKRSELPMSAISAKLVDG